MLATITDQQKLLAYAKLIRFEKPIGWLLLLWPTMWALWLASNGRPPLKLILIFVLGVFLTRSAGCVLNDLADQQFDAAVLRTLNRPLVTGVVTNREALIIAATLFFISFVLVLQLNTFAILLSVIGLALASIYPFLKRVTHLPQVWLGVAFAWGIPMAFAATLNHIPWSAWYLFVTTLIWIVAYDSMYAMVDREDDLKIGVKSTAILFGDYDVVIIAALQSAVLVLLVAFGFMMKLSWVYFISLTVAASLACHQVSLIKTRVPEKCFRAFLNNNWFGLVVFAGFVFAL